MAEKDDKRQISMPVLGMVLMSILGGLLVAAQCEVIKFWPSPASIAPPFGPEQGLIWGLIDGAVVGLVIGYIADDKHYSND